ncbi:MAG: hypothetical protein EOP34_11885, partial [Rickettsiales bacterium]
MKGSILIKKEDDTQIFKKSLLEDGFFVVRDVLTQDFVKSLQKDLRDIISKNHEKHGNLGTVIDYTYQTNSFCELIQWDKTLEILKNIGFLDPKFWSGYIVCKGPQSPKGYWHQDWIYWDNAISAAAIPPQLFIMYYMVPTTIDNGCLRVIKGTHRNKIELHNYTNDGHDGSIITQNTETSLGYQDHSLQIPVGTHKLAP